MTFTYCYKVITLKFNLKTSNKSCSTRNRRDPVYSHSNKSNYISRKQKLKYFNNQTYYISHHIKFYKEKEEYHSLMTLSCVSSPAWYPWPEISMDCDGGGSMAHSPSLSHYWNMTSKKWNKCTWRRLFVTRSRRYKRQKNQMSFVIHDMPKPKSISMI